MFNFNKRDKIGGIPFPSSSYLVFKVEDIDVGKVLRVFGSVGILVRVVDVWRVWSVFGV